MLGVAHEHGPVLQGNPQRDGLLTVQLCNALGAPFEVTPGKVRISKRLTGDTPMRVSAGALVFILAVGFSTSASALAAAFWLVRGISR